METGVAAPQQILSELVEGDWSSSSQQVLAELVEGVLSQLVLSRVSQTQHSIFAESTGCLLWQLCGATSQAVCGTLSVHIL